MSVLLRHPATVPALFSRAAEPETRPARDVSAWRRLTANAPLLGALSWATVMVIDVPLLKAATLAVALALPG